MHKIANACKFCIIVCHQHATPPAHCQPPHLYTLQLPFHAVCLPHPPLRIPPFLVPAPIEMLSIIVRRIDHFAFTFSFAFTYRVHLPLLIATRASSSYCCCCCCQETLQHTITIFHFPYSETTTTAAATINGAIFNYHFRISRSLLIVSVCFNVCVWVCV